jgi:ribosome-associated protein YbcJ (S4-like RNA binding protein)
MFADAGGWAKSGMQPVRVKIDEMVHNRNAARLLKTAMGPPCSAFDQ